MVPLDRNYSLLKLVDFGLSVSLSSLDGRHSVEECGTLLYMAPERLAGRKCTTKSDLYSLGILMLELLTGISEVGNQLVGSKERTKDYFIRYDWSRDSCVRLLTG